MSAGFVADVLAVGTRHRWRDDAACGPARLPEGVEPGDFFVVASGRGVYGRAQRQRLARAIAVCKTCPVIKDCAAYVEEMPPSHRIGVWAGQLFTQKDAQEVEAV